MDFELDLRIKITTHQVRSQYVGLFSVMLLYSYDRRTTQLNPQPLAQPYSPTHINLFQAVEGSNQRFVGLGLPVYGLATPLRLSYE